MQSVRERIQINSQPITETSFRDRFLEVWDALPGEPSPKIDIPRYLQLLALLSFHVFIKEGVDVAIYETHLGGEYDATNVVTSPVVTAITSVAMDHMELLGSSIEDIARHKAGIFKPGAKAFSAPQQKEVVRVLKDTAAERNAVLAFVDVDPVLTTDAIWVGTETQKINYSIAIAIVRDWLSMKAPGASLNKEEILHVLENFRWSGRYEEIQRGKYHWFIDGAHNESALRCSTEWFVQAISKYKKFVTLRITWRSSVDVGC